MVETQGIIGSIVLGRLILNVTQKLFYRTNRNYMCLCRLDPVPVEELKFST